ncbi:MAG: 4-hydroxy-tetrahydrodipicolinate synthase [Rhodospirillaceae bacterium]|jgi:4-hydroxy-tetrahydrodipicolinate synthase|nr:4-hydroxy-tetrahydrodipicolinate synthase [Rhodospirillaceae bacterium]MBT5239992.1 4-hydroxy-tetrahydrodipicolinate synthase [Rhodospirillaceae bacterium]MBT5564346.1 4-hydroxy-tetrahydrodipicolinate synthase [Rhodospirillaceae bacterium]MBT6090091.1 4-hydroxy-tetrahydrodipicolinate synthase [Rhodospirillaceae bacterium]
MIKLGQNFLRGAYTPLITPFNGWAVDYDAYARFVDWQIRNGAQGLVVGGTSGEPMSLTITERQNLLRIAVSSARRRVPVVAQTGGASLADTWSLTEHAEQVGADAIMLMMPPFVKPPQRGLKSFLSFVSRATTKPILLYQIPSRTVSTIEIDTLEDLCEEVPSIVGLKQSSDDEGFDTEVISRLGGEFRLFMGLPRIELERIPEGASGLIVALANLVPGKIAEICSSADERELTKAIALRMELEELNDLAFRDTSPIGVKYMAWKMGLITSGECRLPLMPPEPEHVEAMDDALEAAGLL